MQVSHQKLETPAEVWLDELMSNESRMETRENSDETSEKGNHLTRHQSTAL